MQDPAPTLEYAKIIDGAEALRRRMRVIAAWMAIAWATIALFGHLMNYWPQIAGNVGSLSSFRANEYFMLIGAAMGLALTYPLMILAGILLLAEKPQATLLLRISVGIILTLSLAMLSYYLISLRNTSIPNFALRQSTVMLNGACFPLLLAFLPLQRRNAGV